MTTGVEPLFNISNGIRYAALNGADIIVAGFSGRYLESAGLDAEPIKDFVDNGGLFIAAAGNQGSDNTTSTPTFPQATATMVSSPSPPPTGPMS